MAKYVDGFVIVIPKNKVADYKKMAEDGARLWKKHGALEYFECMGEDLIPKSMGGMTPLSFPKLTKAKSDDTVWFSFIVFESKEQRDKVNAKVMEEMSKEKEKYMDVSMPFEMKHFSYGGFDVIVEG